MAKYRKKPIEIEAVQFLGFDVNGEECERFLGNSFETHLPNRNEIVVRTVHGEEAVIRVGDWIIPDGKPGTFYPCKPDIFVATYEPVQR